MDSNIPFKRGKRKILGRELLSPAIKKDKRINKMKFRLNFETEEKVQFLQGSPEVRLCQPLNVRVENRNSITTFYQAFPLFY